MERAMMHRLLRDMLLSRVFEERAAEEYGKGNIVGFLHLYPGEEAVAAGVINAAGPPTTSSVRTASTPTRW